MTPLVVGSGITRNAVHLLDRRVQDAFQVVDFVIDRGTTVAGNESDSVNFLLESRLPLGLVRGARACALVTETLCIGPLAVLEERVSDDVG